MLRTDYEEVTFTLKAGTLYLLLEVFKPCYLRVKNDVETIHKLFRKTATVFMFCLFFSGKMNRCKTTEKKSI
jgi:hypothetical protein